MDPEQTLLELVTAITVGDFGHAHGLLEDLEEWHNKGGYLPTGKELP
jgi:hypothetical protein